ncbi:MAG: LamG-like jellyroll fold domain-containing protein [Calditrichaceae bacterium]
MLKGYHKISIAGIFSLLLSMSFLFANPSGYSISFDGIDDYVQIQDDPSLDMTMSFTIAAWVYLEDYVEWASIVTKGGFDGDPELGENNYTIHQTADGRLRFTGCADLPIPLPESNTVIPLNEWHYVALTFDGSMLQFYLDGNPDGAHALNGPLCTNDQPLNIGADFPGDDEYWHGMIDEVRIWNEALKPAHIRAAMNGHAAPKASALAGYWRFDDGSGITAKDRSRNKNHGRLMNGASWMTPGAPIGHSSVAEDLNESLPIVGETFRISNHPNPFNPETNITFNLPEASNVTIQVFNSLGQEIRRLTDNYYNAGFNSVKWDGRDNRGALVASGIYFYMVRSGKYLEMRKMTLFK